MTFLKMCRVFDGMKKHLFLNSSTLRNLKNSQRKKITKFSRKLFQPLKIMNAAFSHKSILSTQICKDHNIQTYGITFTLINGLPFSMYKTPVFLNVY